MKKITLLLIFLLALASAFLSASPISENRARELAETLFQQPATRTNYASLKLVYAPTTSTRSGDTSNLESAYYVFAPQSKGGFIIISGDDALPSVVGYSYQNEFDINQIPIALKEWLKGYEAYVMAIQSNNSALSNQESRTTGKAVEPLLTTIWDQSRPFNDLCPKIGSSQAPSGCVATAMAQLMKYHNWPKESNTTLDKMKEDYGYQFADLQINHQLDWANMINEYKLDWDSETQSTVPLYTEAEGAAVANLMIQCGISVNMSYGAKESSALSFRVANSLKKYFKYTPQISFHRRNSFRADEWLALIRSNLENKLPIYYSGSGSGGGHAFICDGIDTENMLHINWGWGGYCDGYFDMCYLNPDGVGIGGGNGFFNQNHAIIVNIKPLAEGEEENTVISPVLTVTGFKLTSQNIIPKSDTENYFSFKMDEVGNYTDQNTKKYYYYGLAVADQTGKILAKSTYSAYMSSGYYLTNSQFPFSPTSSFINPETKEFWPNGTYQILPVMWDSQYSTIENVKDLLPMNTDGGISKFTLTITDTDFTVTPDKDFPEPDFLIKSISQNSKIYTNTNATDNGRLIVNIENLSPTLCSNGSFRINFVAEANDHPDIVLDDNNCVYHNDIVYGSVQMDLFPYAPYITESGKYRVYVSIINNEGVYQVIKEESPQYIEVIKKPTTPIITLTNTIEIYYDKENRKSDFLTTYFRAKANKTYNGPVAIYALKEGDTEEKEVKLLESDVRVTTSPQWIDQPTGNSNALLLLEGGTYRVYLKYKLDGEMVKMEPEVFNTATMILPELKKNFPTLTSPIVINDNNPVVSGSSFKIKATFMSIEDYTGSIEGYSNYYTDAWRTAAVVNSYPITLKANQPQEVILDATCYSNIPPSSYSFEFFYTEENHYYSIPLGEYSNTVSFEVVASEFKLNAPLNINEGLPLAAGQWHNVKATLLSNVDYTGKITGGSEALINNEEKSVGFISPQDITLKANEPQEVTLQFYCNPNIPSGNYKIYLKRSNDRGYYDLISLGNYESSANYEIADLSIVVTAPMIINNGNPIETRTSFKVKATIMASANYLGEIYGGTIVTVGNNLYYYTILDNTAVDLKANTPQEIEFNGVCNYNAEPGTYPLTLLYSNEGQTNKVSMGNYEASSMHTIIKKQISHAAPTNINDGKPLLANNSYSVKATLLSTIDYNDIIWGTVTAYDNDKIVQIGNVTATSITLKANEAKEVSLNLSINQEVKAGNYQLNLLYLVNNMTYTVLPGEYNSSLQFDICDFKLIPTEAIVINEGKDIEQGAEGIASITLQANADYEGELSVLDQNSSVTGEKTVVTLNHNTPKTIDLKFKVNASANLGQSQLNFIYSHPVQNADSIVVLSQHAESAIFNIIAATGIDGGLAASSIYAFVTENGFKLSGLEVNDEIQVYDTHGKLIKHFKASTTEEEIRIDTLQQRNLIVAIINKNKKVVLKVFIP